MPPYMETFLQIAFKVYECMYGFVCGTGSFTEEYFTDVITDR